MTLTPQTRSVEVAVDQAGAYRVRLLGAEPGDVTQTLVSGGVAATVQVAPGDYTAIVESLTGPARGVSKVQIGRGVVRIRLNAPEPADFAPVSSPSRPSRATFSMYSGGDADSLPGLEVKSRSTPTFSSRTSLKTQAADTSDPAADESLDALMFSVGVSIDKYPGRSGGWTAFEPDTTIERDPKGQWINITIRRGDDWRRSPKWRLTLSVEGDLAWRAPLPLFEGGLLVQLRPTQTAHGPDLSVTFRPVQPALSTLVVNLNRLAPDEAQQVLEWSADGAKDGDAIELLAHKKNDPWAAAAAALLLVRLGEVGSVNTWIQRLANDFNWLPDAAVAAAWSHAAASDDPTSEVEAACLRHLIDARERGAPYFSLSNRMALELLSALALGGEESVVRTSARTERRAWARHGQRSLRTGAFMAWEHPGPTLMSGRLPKATYATLVSGRLTERSVLADD